MVRIGSGFAAHGGSPTPSRSSDTRLQIRTAIR